ncbi:hypothetical protein BESB_054740 [Besnoitia besnoiti]|uniref:AB hydrolase-1 domain-containing protein n=1 Tax=Besnoitia besnoiti TaxID=94643 RepID=A0A2A9MJJ2_BESBE|nr:hypothetical protein BESB_054740 [Besnoitia besnoiti]PFH35823.1 hypothetical protein BESB_054740 [Besnoitia besnoiti]
MWGPTRVGAEEEKGTEETPALTGACARRAASSACLAFQVEGRRASRANARCFPVGLPEKKIGPCIQAAGQQGTAEGSVSPGGCLAVPALSPGSPSNAPPAEDVANRGVTPQSEGDLREPALAAPSFPLSRAVDLAYQEVFPTLHHASLSSGPSLLSPASPSGSASPPGASPVASRGARRAPLVLVLHGMFRCGDDMLELCSQLHAERVLAVDLRNHGASPFTSSMFLQDMAADVIALIQRELGLSRPRGAGPGPAGTEGELDERGGRPARGGFRDAEASSLRAAEEFPGCEAEPSQARSCGMQARPSRARAAPPHHSASSTAPVASSGCPPRPSVWQRPRGCTVVGHSLGGQVALAAALRAPAGLISGVVALDICPVNYYDWPLPRAGPYDIRDLVELVAAPLLVGDGSKQKALERLGEVAPALKGAGARSLLCLLAEEEVPANRDEEEETCCPQDHARSEERGERGCDSADGGSATQRSHEADGRIQENVTPHGGEEGERACCAPLHSGQAERRVKSPRRSYKTVKKLRWKMNTPVLRDSFRNKTLRWDLPAALSSAQAAPALSSQPHSSSDSLPLTPSTAFSAVPGGVRRPSPSSSAPPTSREAHAAVESFHKPPSPYTGPVLIVRGLCSPWVDPARHWSAIKNYFPAARGLTLESAGHAVHVDQPQETAEAINALLHEVVADA